MEDEPAIFAVDANGTTGNLRNRDPRDANTRDARKRPAPQPHAADWGVAREERGVFQERRNPGKQPMYSRSVKEKSGVVETDLRAAGVTAAAAAADSRAARAARPRT